ncbi:MAG: hypothetical protein AAF677_03970 [Pseudomonadota bacterium]
MHGDVALFFSESNKSILNRSFQKLFQKDKLPIPTHVALFRGERSLIHSILDGVEETLIYELFPPGSDFRIIRYQPLYEDLKKSETSLMYFLAEIHKAACNGYSMWYKVKSCEQRVFCSELVAKIIKGLRLDVFGPPHSVLPIDIVHLMRQDRENWIDVTSEFRKNIENDLIYKNLYDPNYSEKIKDAIYEAKILYLKHRFCSHQRVHSFFHSKIDEYLDDDGVALMEFSDEYSKKKKSVARRRLFGRAPIDSLPINEFSTINDDLLDRVSCDFPEEKKKYFLSFMKILSDEDETAMFKKNLGKY